METKTRDCQRRKGETGSQLQGFPGWVWGSEINFDLTVAEVRSPLELEICLGTLSCYLLESFCLFWQTGPTQQLC
jgi:hypothetical protein